MSLVAYAASSDEESENEDETTGVQVELLKPTPKPSADREIDATKGHISDEDDDFMPQEVSLQELKPASGRLTLSLPKPKLADIALQEEESADEQVTQGFAKLPMPRTAATAGRAYVEEADDEFLHKKATVSATLEKPPPAAVKTRVKISIPSLRDFADVDREQAAKQQGRQCQVQHKKGSSLLSMLPQAKSERDFAKKNDAGTMNSNENKATAAPAFVPDTVKLRRAAHNTEGIDRSKAQTSKQAEKPSSAKSKPAALVSVSDSEEEDLDQPGDYFSLHSEQQLPEVSSNEINALVAKRAAKMAEASSKYLAEESRKAAEAEAEATEQQLEQLRVAQQRYQQQQQQLNTEAMDALVGKNAKRRRKETKEMQVIDISGSQVMPDREEWMRTALASATTYQPTGVLTDEEPVAGTRRKHQITYLAHKAKANEAELQAMWSANRQTRRATQSKYGF